MTPGLRAAFLAEHQEHHDLSAAWAEAACELPGLLWSLSVGYAPGLRVSYKAWSISPDGEEWIERAGVTPGDALRALADALRERKP
jgi:hypothetical protein